MFWWSSETLPYSDPVVQNQFHYSQSWLQLAILEHLCFWSAALIQTVKKQRAYQGPKSTHLSRNCLRGMFLFSFFPCPHLSLLPPPFNEKTSKGMDYMFFPNGTQERGGSFLKYTLLCECQEKKEKGLASKFLHLKKHSAVFIRKQTWVLYLADGGRWRRIVDSI